MRSAKRRHQSPELAILSQVDRFVQGEVKRFQVLLVRGRPGGLLQFSRGGAVKICCFVWQTRNVAEQGETPCLDNAWPRGEGPL